MAKPRQKNNAAVAYGVTWHKLNFPKPWKPEEPGAELVGYYLGQTHYTGQFGQYRVVLLAVPTGQGYSQPYTISGTAILRAIDGGQVAQGQLLRVTFRGIKNLGDDRHLKQFDVFVGDGQIDDAVANLLYRRLLEEEYGDVREDECSD